MSLIRQIQDYFQKPAANSVDYSSAERELRWKSLQEDQGLFLYDEHGFSYVTPERSEAVKWIDVEHIIAYKVDCFSYDVICLRIYWEGSNLFICEEDPGWYQFIRRLNDALPVAGDWERLVTFPAFKTNETLVYQKQVLLG